MRASARKCADVSFVAGCKKGLSAPGVWRYFRKMIIFARFTQVRITMKKNILKTIGNTPMVRINRLCPNPNVNIYAKLEGFNPTGSIKDRIALKMIEAAEQDGG